MKPKKSHKASHKKLRDKPAKGKKSSVFSKEGKGGRILAKSAKYGGGLPEICVLSITGSNEDGDLLASPINWQSHKHPPHIVVLESGRGKAAALHDRILAKLRPINKHTYQASIIRILESEQQESVIGVFVATSGGGGIIEPISRKNKESYMVAAGDCAGAMQGELVSALTLPNIPSMGMSYAKITERLGRIDAPKAASLIAASVHKLPSIFSQEALAEAKSSLRPLPSKEREDLREVPLVTIDGADARDFDDAVFAEPDGDGFHLIVAIAEVAFYVKEGGALDGAAFERGNSVYFPDRVIPMLPEHLSNGLCSLNPDEDRYCLAVHLWIDGKGKTKKYKFVRGIMRSAARLTYEQVESASGRTVGNKPAEQIDQRLLPLIVNLYNAYAALAHERDQRGALDLDLPEYKIQFDESGNVSSIDPKNRLESHRLIECFMIAANVAAADFLLHHKAGGIFRVHDAPSEEKLDEVRTLLAASDYRLQKGAVSAKHFNQILGKSAHDPRRPMIHIAVLRAQMQAFYSAENTGHFGLSLQKYCHFTSPIRRYADLMVHRTIVAILAHDDASEKSEKKHPRHSQSHLAEIALHISETERRAMLAERDAADRYKVLFMAREVGNVFAGVISGLNEYGLFVTVSATGVTGFVPVRNLGGDFFVFDRKHANFTSRNRKTSFALGDSVVIKVQEANPVTGSLIFGIGEQAGKGAKLQQNPAMRSKKNYHAKNKVAGKSGESSSRKLKIKPVKKPNKPKKTKKKF